MGKFIKGQSGNPKGRPKKSLDENNILTSSNQKALKLAQMKDALAMLLVLTENELRNLVADKATPLMLRLVAKGLLSGNGFEVLEKVLNRVFGRPKTEPEDSTPIEHNIIIRRIDKALGDEFD